MRDNLSEAERRTYLTWQGMKQRCYDANHRAFHNYGGRGISVCQEWHNFDSFLHDMGPRQDGVSIERVDPNGNYEPSNCKWATATEQARNQRRKRTITVDGTPYHVAELAERYHLNMRTIAVRHERGYSLEQILSQNYLHGTKNRTKTHCKRGHEFTAENTYVWNGHRSCRICLAEKDKRWKAKRKESHCVL